MQQGVIVCVIRHWYFDWSCILRVYSPRAASPVRASRVNHKSHNLYRDQWYLRALGGCILPSGSRSDKKSRRREMWF